VRLLHSYPRYFNPPARLKPRSRLNPFSISPSLFLTSIMSLSGYLRLRVCEHLLESAEIDDLVNYFTSLLSTED
jgi:hypothetical protein